MSDLHHLPLIGRDMPAHVDMRRPVKVYKEGRFWTWHHWCLDRPKANPASGYPHDTREHAQEFALKHWRACL